MSKANRVLVIGDETTSEYVDLLESADYSVEVVSSEEEAEQSLASEHYDVVISAPTAAERVSAQRELLQGIIDYIPVMITIYDPHLKRFQFNREFRRVLGWTEADTSEGDFISKVYPDPDCRQIVMEYMQSLETGWRDFQVTAKDGSAVESSWANIRLSDDTMVGIGVDIRERKRAEEAIRSVALFPDENPDPVMRVSAAGELSYANSSGNTFLQECGSDSEKGLWDSLAKAAADALSTASTMRVDVVCNAMTFSFVLAPIADQQYVNLYGRDVTENKRTEEALRESEEQFRDLAESMPQLVWTATADGKVDYYNSRVAQYAGFERRPDGTWNWQPVLHSDDTDITVEAWQAAVANQHVYQVEHRVHMADGSYRWHLSRAFPVRQHDGVVKWFGTATDIHEVKQTQEKLQESELRYSALFANKTNGIAHCRVVTDESGTPVDYTILEVNEAYEEITGIQKADIEGKLATEVFPGIESFSFDYIGNYGKVALEGGELSIEVFFETLEQWLSIYIYSPKHGEFVAMLTDVTPQKQAEEGMQKAREDAERRAAELTSYFRSMAEGAVLIDSSGKLTFMNDAGREILRIPTHAPTPASLAEYSVRTLAGQPMERNQAASYRALRGETVQDLRHIVVTPDGEEVLVSASASPVIDEDGRILGATTVFRDISATIQFEEYQEEQLQRERHISEMLQNAILSEPEENIPCCEVAVKYQPALEEAYVGGDFYDIFSIRDNKHGVLIGDVAGKGLAAARQVTAARYAIRHYSYLNLRPAKIMTLANDALARETDEDASMITAFFAKVEAEQGEVTYVNAGHETVLLVKANGEIEELEAPGMPLGVLCKNEYQDVTMKLEVGDTLVMVTDGITEARTVPTKLFGVKGVKRCLTEMHGAAPEEIAEKILERAMEFGGGELRDDVAIVVFRFTGLNGR